MPPRPDPQPRRIGPRSGALKVAVAYALLAGLWIAVSDLLLESALGVERALTVVEISKGLAFVAVTATGLYFFVRHQLTAQRELVEKRLADEQWFRALVENADEVFSVLDREGLPVYRSPAFQRILGYDALDARTIRFLDLVHPADRPVAERALGEILRMSYRTSPRLLLRLRRKDRGWRVCEAVLTNLLEHPAVGGIVVNWRERSGPVPEGD
jgi:PAS domain S-box-containing protein